MQVLSLFIECRAFFAKIIIGIHIVEHDKMADAYSLMNQKLQHSLNENSNLEKAILELKVCITKHSFIFPFIVTFRFT